MKAFFKIITLVFVSVIFLLGCLPQVHRDALNNLVNYRYQDGRQISHAAASLSHLQLPLRGAIMFVPETYYEAGWSLTQTKNTPWIENVVKQINFREKKRLTSHKTFNAAIDKKTSNLPVQLDQLREQVKLHKVVTESYRYGYGGSYSWIGILFLILLIRFTRKYD